MNQRWIVTWIPAYAGMTMKLKLKLERRTSRRDHQHPSASFPFAA
jgi:hypothetical protein